MWNLVGGSWALGGLGGAIQSERMCLWFMGWDGGQLPIAIAYCLLPHSA